MKKTHTTAWILLLAPVVVIGGSVLFRDKQYAWVSLCVAVLACVPPFVRFERRQTDAKELILLAVLVALSVVGRIAFAPLPSFKPVTALVVIAALHFGPEAGFLSGALSALISNFYFGQGPWTPFQMLSWGLLGFLAGVLAKPLTRHRWLLLAYGALSGVLFSCVMDIWTVLSMGGGFSVARYLAAVVSAGRVTVIYAVSNVMFLLVLAPPIGKILTRVKQKYGLQK